MQWLSDHSSELLIWVTVVSFVTLIGAVVAVPWVVARLPVDYFRAPQRSPYYQRHGLPGLLLSAFKNLLGLALVLLGLVLLVTPGQGLLTILLGVLLMNFPGKYRLERYFARKQQVRKALNWMRERRGKPPFEF